ncbi:Endonuclease-reverse transcriptase [Operophtera brumata]|uniref:Endonuclease-reverse transcriptase n=1 Tax=Operophtera brumata TaxID=104452 RepID=A0A0L7L7P3_OPEBR|nr:Endonuclease-reverse transcriptase [Operophtera brumata]
MDSKHAENKIRLRSFQRAVERSMMGLKLRDRIRSSKIRSKTKILDAGKKATTLKWKWAGHIARVKDNRWSERVLHWWPRDGKRERGRPVCQAVSWSKKRTNTDEDL